MCRQILRGFAAWLLLDVASALLFAALVATTASAADLGRTGACPSLSDPEQPDADQDGIADDCDNCPLVENPRQGDRDGDGIGNRCDVCPTVPNPDQDPVDCDCPCYSASDLETILPASPEYCAVDALEYQCHIAIFHVSYAFTLGVGGVLGPWRYYPFDGVHLRRRDSTYWCNALTCDFNGEITRRQYRACNALLRNSRSWKASGCPHPLESGSGG